MTSFDRFERSLPELLDELSAPRLPDYADDLFARTAATRQRSRWSFPERWFLMSAITRRFAAVPRIPWRLGVAVALLALVAVLAVVVAGALQDRAPTPFGPAGNGQVAFLDREGQILLAEPATDTTRVLVGVPGNTMPTFSSDGTRIAFLRASEAPFFDLHVVGVEGGTTTKLNVAGIITPSYLGWSPRGDRLLVIDGGGQALLFATTSANAPETLAEDLGLGGLGVGAGYNFRSSAAFRPPDGSELLFVSNGGGALVAVRADGTGYRTLLDRTNQSPKISEISGAQWSPDGTQVLLMIDAADSAQRKSPYVLGADGTGLHILHCRLASPLIDVNSPSWSPDGRKVAFQYWTSHADDEGQDFHPIGVVDITTGAFLDVGPLLVNGATWGWSPDGTSILELPGDQPGVMLVIDASTGTFVREAAEAYDAVDWQRVKR